MTFNSISLSEIAEVVRGVSYNKSEVSDKPQVNYLPILRAGNINGELILNEGLVYVPSDKIKKHQKLNINDIVMCTSSGSVSVVGKSAILKKNWAGSFGAFCAAIRADETECSASYLAHYLSSPRFMSWASRSGGANIKNIRSSELKNFRIPLPPLPEQKRIAAILDKADAIRRKRQEALELADTFLRSVFLKMFGDPVTNPMGWDEKNFNEVVSQIVGGWSAKGEEHCPCDSEKAVLKVSAVTYGIYRPDECKVVDSIPQNKKLVVPQQGDLLFSRANTRQLVGATCIVTETKNNVFLPDKLWRIDCDKDVALSEYIKFLFSHPRFRELISRNATGTSGSMLNISKQKLLGMTIPVPPLQKQKEFAQLFWKMDTVLGKLRQEHDESNNLFSSLQQRAFRGDL